MKKLLVLMIVLFSVTAWAGSHEYIEKPRRVLCDDLYQSAPGKLRAIGRVNYLYNAAKKSKNSSLAAFYKNETKEARQELAQEAAIYTAFCK